MRAPIHVLHVFGRLQRGGAEIRTLELLHHLDRRAIKFSFVALSGESGPLDRDVKAASAQVFPLRLQMGFGRKFRRLLHELNPDVVHSHVHYSSGYILWQARRAGVPGRIAHFRSSSDGQRSSPRRLVQRAVMRYLIDHQATCIAAVSRGAMEAAWRRDWQCDPRCRIAYNGIDVARFREPADRDAIRAEFRCPPDAKLLIHIGAFEPAKNHRFLLQVFSRLAMDDPRTRLILIGRTGVELAPIQNLIASLPGGDRVFVAGERRDVPRLLGAADLLLFPSIREGLPGAVLEATAAGVPVVASDLPGIREIAAYCPTVECIGTTSVDRWVARSKELIAGTAAGRSATLNDMLDTPFAIETAAKTYLGLVNVALSRPTRSLTTARVAASS